MNKALFTLLIACALVACDGNTTDKATADTSYIDELYETNDVEWSMDIPEGWDSIPMSELMAESEVGGKIIEEGTGKEFRQSIAR